jgi:hypothetical protein
MIAAVQFLDCPACGKAFAAAEGSLQICPVCGHQFFLQEPEVAEYDDAAREAAEMRIESEREKLDLRHIKAIQLERRSIFRNRTWLLVGAWTCIGVAGQLVWLGVRWFLPVSPLQGWVRPPNPVRGAAYMVLAAGLVIFSIHFFRHARRLLIVAKQTVIPEPSTPPDFEPLSDGSQFVSQLSQMVDEREDEET